MVEIHHTRSRLNTTGIAPTRPIRPNPMRCVRRPRRTPRCQMAMPIRTVGQKTGATTMSKRVPGIFQKIDPWISDDPAILEAGGAFAELLYIRGLCYIRRSRTYGTIPKKCFGEISDGIPSAQKYCAGLVKAELWIETDDGRGWTVRNWSCWNLTKDEEQAIAEDRTELGKLGAHGRWHSAVRPNNTCEACRDEGWL